jgi:acid phosphatase
MQEFTMLQKRKAIASSICVVMMLATLVCGSSKSSLAAQVSHVVVVVEENHSYSQVIGNSSMPYLNSLAKKYGFASSYYGDAPPSLPNYFMLTVGNTVTYSDSFTGTVSANNIVRQLLLAGLSQARMRFNIHASLGLRNTRAF